MRDGYKRFEVCKSAIEERTTKRRGEYVLTLFDKRKKYAKHFQEAVSCPHGNLVNILTGNDALPNPEKMWIVSFSYVSRVLFVLNDMNMNDS